MPGHLVNSWGSWLPIRSSWPGHEVLLIIYFDVTIFKKSQLLGPWKYPDPPWNPAPEQGHWRSRGDAPSGDSIQPQRYWQGHVDTPGSSGAQPPSSVTGGVTEMRRVLGIFLGDI